MVLGKLVDGLYIWGTRVPRLSDGAMKSRLAGGEWLLEVSAARFFYYQISRLKQSGGI
jgi:hypothetical protein